MLRAALHAASAAYYVWLLHYVFYVVPDVPGLERFVDFKPKYFSIWGLAAQVVLLTLCFADDVGRLASPSSTSPARQTLARIRDVFFVGCAAPLALTGCLMYAGLCLWDRDLIMPPELDANIPWWLNQAMHSTSAAQVVIQMLVEPMGVPSLRASVILGGAVSHVYMAVTLDEYVRTGRWLYPILAVLGWPGRLALGAFFVVLTLAQVFAIRVVMQGQRGACPFSKKQQ